MTHKSFPTHIHNHLKYYVYVYRDPRNHEVFYVGKGQKNRAFSHLNDGKDSEKRERIKLIRSVGREPEILILAHGLDDELIALKVEAAAIDLLGLHQITNSIRGFESTEFGQMTLDQLISRYEAEEVEIVDPVCLIRPNRLFRYGMSVQDLYDTTRGIWDVKPKLHKIAPKFALCIYAGVVQEVYKIADWFPAGSTLNSRGDLDVNEASDRWEFVGSIAPKEVRKKYIYKSVAKYLPKYAQGSVLYVNC